MMKQLVLENWKSFRKATLYIDPFTVLIGTNASGKSNVLDALDFLHRMVSGMSVAEAIKGTSLRAPIRGGTETVAQVGTQAFSVEALLQYDTPAIEYRYGIHIQTKPDFRLVGEHLTEVKHSVSNNEAPEIVELLSETSAGYKSPTRSRVSQLDGSMFAAQTNAIQSMKDIFITDPIPQRMRSFSELADHLYADASNIAGVLANLPPERKQEVEQTLIQYVTGLPEGDIKRVWAEPVGRLATDAMLYCEEQWHATQAPMLIDARSMSDGTLRFIAILVTLLTRPAGSLVAIEDVDSGLHPSRARVLLHMVRQIGQQRSIDVLVTTHNPALLNALEPDFIPFVTVVHRDPATGESKLTLLEHVPHLPKLLASGSLGQLAEQGAIERSLRMSHERGE